MTIPDLLRLLAKNPIVVSAQAAPESPLADRDSLLKLAQASLGQGVEILRLQGVENILHIRGAIHAPVIGLIKRDYTDSQIYITPTAREVRELLATGCEIIALDATPRARPGGERLGDLIRQIHEGNRLAMADCDNLASVGHALECGADIISTTLAGYTDQSPPMAGPDLEFLRAAVAETDIPVLAEGRFAEKWQVQTAMRIGAAGLVMGGAVNDPVKQTRMFSQAVAPLAAEVSAFDIGGTWLRHGRFSPDWKLLNSERVPLPRTREERTEWMRARAGSRAAVSTGGTVDPHTGEIWEAKDEVIPEATGTKFDWPALNDGLASAWAHACLPQFAGTRVATLALGSGVGFGLVDRHQIFCGTRGEYPRLNDLEFRGSTVEHVLGGLNLDNRKSAREAALFLLDVLMKLYMPDHIVLCGGVGLSEWLDLPGTVTSPFGEDAGLYGAAALALFPPEFR